MVEADKVVVADSSDQIVTAGGYELDEPPRKKTASENLRRGTFMETEQQHHSPSFRLREKLISTEMKHFPQKLPTLLVERKCKVC